VLNGVITYYAGNYFEWRGNTTTMSRYYLRGLFARDPGVLRNMLFAETASATRDLVREFAVDRLSQPR
jgi:hypothetical protein